jgi:hypothetical protein
MMGNLLLFAMHCNRWPKPHGSLQKERKPPINLKTPNVKNLNH